MPVDFLKLCDDNLIFSAKIVCRFDILNTSKGRRERQNRILIPPLFKPRCMCNVGKNRLQRDSNLAQTIPTNGNATKIYVADYSGDEIKKALVYEFDLTSPLDELIATGEAMCEFIRHVDMEVKTKNAFGQLEKQFEFYRNLLLLSASQPSLG